jgi:hypothetical protein
MNHPLFRMVGCVAVASLILATPARIVRAARRRSVRIAAFDAWHQVSALKRGRGG